MKQMFIVGFVYNFFGRLLKWLKIFITYTYLILIDLFSTFVIIKNNKKPKNNIYIYKI